MGQPRWVEHSMRRDVKNSTPEVKIAKIFNPGSVDRESVVMARCAHQDEPPNKKKIVGLLRRFRHVGYQMVTSTVVLFFDTIFF